MEVEIWKPVVGYEKLYKVSNFGRVMNRKKKIMKHWVNRLGYCKIHLFEEGIREDLSIHRLVADAFLQKDTGCMEIDHIDQNKQNNHVSNLRWTTKSQNCFNRKPVQESNTKHKYICFTANRYRIWIRHLGLNTTRQTLEEAIQLRDEFLASLN